MSSPERLRSPLGPNPPENRERQLEGKIALITGSSRDIGAGIAISLAEEGVAIIGNYRDKDKKAGETKEKIEAVGGKIEFVKADITVPSDRERLRTKLNESFGGKLDFLILSASGPSRDINVVANNALVNEFLPQTSDGGKTILIQSVPGHFDLQLRGLGKMPSSYDPVAKAKYEGERSLIERIPEFQDKDVSLVVVCPPIVPETFNARRFDRESNKEYGATATEKHAEISDMLGIPRTVTTKDIGEKVAELLKRKDLPQGYVELFGNVLDARSILSEWYGDNAIFVDTLEISDESRGVGRTIIANQYTQGHFNEKVGMKVIPGHIMIEAGVQTLGLIALNGKVADESMPLFQGIDKTAFFKTAKPGEGLKIHGVVTELTKRGFVGNVNITNIKDQKIAEITGIKATVLPKAVAMRLMER